MSTSRRAAAAPLLLVTGASGHLGGHLVRRAGSGWRVAGTYLTRQPPAEVEAYRVELRDASAVEALFERLRPAAVIHTAYRRHEPDVNLDGTRHLAAACARFGARLVFVSTDLVFDGRRGWYREADSPSPIDPYGASKAAAEQEALAIGGAVARTSLIYGFDPVDPVNRALLLEPLARGERPRLFVDEYRCPAYAPDLADALLELAAGGFRAILHLAGPQRVSRYDFGLKLAGRLGLDPASFEPARICESGLLRAPDCSLDTSLAREFLGTRIRSVDEAVAADGSEPQSHRDTERRG